MSRFVAITCLLVLTSALLLGQADQGSITGTVLDQDSLPVPKAVVVLEQPSTGLRLQETTNNVGVFEFSPLKTGEYEMTVSAAGFGSVHRTGLVVNVNLRLGVDFTLAPASVAEHVEVQDNALQLRTQEASVGQVFDSNTVSATPAPGRNYVFLVQLAAGVNAPNAGSRGTVKGDFSANGQRAEQNNFLLDGVDNNVALVDFLNSASYVIKPPPDAIQEFRVQTSNYSAEVGRSAGAVVNVSIKSGTNDLHASLWEYFRNDKLNGKDFFQTQKSKYRGNQFGVAVGGPLIKNKLFFFADGELNRLIFGQTGIYTVPTAKMRTGDFSELLNPSLTNQNFARLLYAPGSAGTVPETCGGRQNVLCASQISPIAAHLASLFPNPNRGIAGQTYNNYIFQGSASDNTSQWDSRLDYNASTKDFAFARLSYYNEPQKFPPPLGVLDGGSFNQDGEIANQGRNLALSETHLFSPNLVNEARFGYNQIHAALQQPSQGFDLSSQQGLGGIPYTASIGGLPGLSVSGVSSFGTPAYYPADETMGAFQWLDNLSYSRGRHSLKAGFNLQHIRFDTLQPRDPRGYYVYSGKYTNNPANSGKTGFGFADFLLDQIDNSRINNVQTTRDRRWYAAGYVQDDWKLTPRLTINLGLRYEYAQPVDEIDGHQANFIPNYNGGTSHFLIPSQAQSYPVPAAFANLLSASNIALIYSRNSLLVNPDRKNWAPRFGFGYHVFDSDVIRGGFGLFYGGLENAGYGPNLGQNSPFGVYATFPSGACTPGNCPTNGQSLATGFSNVIASGINNFASVPALRAYEPNAKTAYSEQWNLAWEHRLPFSLQLTTAYVGSVTRHLILDPEVNQVGYLLTPGQSLQANLPFNRFGTGGRLVAYAGDANYNGLQLTMERRLQNGISFLGTYTWSHALDNALPPLGGSGDSFGSIRNWRQLGYQYDYGDSYQDVRHRSTIDVSYDLPVGKGRRFSTGNALVNALAGGWTTGVVFRVQSGTPELVLPNNNPTNGVGSAYAYFVADPYAPGGTPSNTGLACAAQTHTLQTWFNPCSFANPNPATGPNDLAAYGPKGRTMIYGPGYYRFDASLAKSFPVYKEQLLTIRAEAFNLTNHPAFGNPGYTVGPGFGTITTERFGGQGLAATNPDGRLIQLIARYSF